MNDVREAVVTEAMIEAATNALERRRWGRMRQMIEGKGDFDNTPTTIRDDARECLTAALALLSDRREEGAAEPEGGWLIEWPADRQMPVRYWHPTEGHVIDPNHAVRFSRREDAEAMLKREHLFGGAKAVEHMWVALPAPPTGKGASRSQPVTATADAATPTAAPSAAPCRSEGVR